MIEIMEMRAPFFQAEFLLEALPINLKWSGLKKDRLHGFLPFDLWV
jgi:hypothetical protein